MYLFGFRGLRFVEKLSKIWVIVGGLRSVRSIQSTARPSPATGQLKFQLRIALSKRQIHQYYFPTMYLPGPNPTDPDLKSPSRRVKVARSRSQALYTRLPIGKTKLKMAFSSFAKCHNPSHSTF